MTLEEFEAFAWEQMDKYLCNSSNEWVFEWSNTRSTLGMCDEGDYTIYISKPFFLAVLDIKYVIDTLMHEIAHAVVGVRHKHDNVWKTKATELGATPYAVAEQIEVVDEFYSYRLVIIHDSGKLKVDAGGWHSKPRRKLEGLWLKSAPETTVNGLYYAHQTDVKDMQAGTLTLPSFIRTLWK